MRSTLSAIFVCCAGLAVAGCGDDGDSDPIEDTTPTDDTLAGDTTDPGDTAGDTSVPAECDDEACAALNRDVCVDNACGACFFGVGEPNALCCAEGTVPSATGDFCQACPGVPACSGQGTCVTGEVDAMCECDENFSGVACEQQDFCAGLACENGGTCVNGIDSAACECPDGVFGATCEQPCDTVPAATASCSFNDGASDCLGNVDINCGSTPSACDGGVLQPVDFAVALAETADIGSFTFRSDWHTKRVKNWELYASDSASSGPGAGATLVSSGTANPNPWKCEVGEACTAEVPDDCCLNGRDQPQSFDADAIISKFDVNYFATTSAQYWWFRVLDTYQGDHLLLTGVELGAVACTGSGDTTPPTVIGAGDPNKTTTESIVVEFSELMNTSGGWTVGGTMGSMSDGGVWTDAKTLTISPASQWTYGNNTLEVTATDAAGNVMTMPWTRDYFIRCSDGSDCDAGEGCRNDGMCGACQSSAQCPGDQTCAGGGVCQEPECNTTPDCSGGLICQFSECVACSNTSQCWGDDVCVNGACVGCTHSDQCGEGEICSNGSCGGCGGDDAICATYYGSDHSCSASNKCLLTGVGQCIAQGAMGCQADDICTLSFLDSPASHTCDSSSICGFCGTHEICIRGSDGVTFNCADAVAGTPLQ